MSRRLVLAAVIGATMILAAGVSDAPARGVISEIYCNHLVEPMAACWFEQGPGPEIVEGVIKNAANYPGEGTVSVCERIANPETLSNYSRRCANNFVESGSDVIGNRAAHEEALVAAGNNSSFRHTIVGTVYIE